MALKRSIRPDTNSPFRIPLGPALLHLDDILDVYNDLADFSEQWHADLQEAAPQGNETDLDNSQSALVEIRAQNATADSVEDLKDATRHELDHVSLICKSPKIRVDFWLRGAEIIAESDSADVRSYSESLNRFVQGKKNWLIPSLAVRKRELLGIFALVAYYFIAILLPVPYEVRIYPDSWTYVLFGGFLVLLFFQIYRQNWNAVRISPEWRREVRGISGKTRRNLATGLFTAIVAGALGLWAGLLTHSESPRPAIVPPAARSAAQPELCGLTKAEDGSAGPITCPDGNPNLAVDRYYRRLNLKILSLNANASTNAVAAAICEDFAAGHTTKPIEASAAELASIEQHWEVQPPSVTDISGILANCRKYTASPSP